MFLPFCLLMNSITNTNMRKNISKAATIPIINPAFEELDVDLKKRGGDFVEFDVKFLEFVERNVAIVELCVELDVEYAKHCIEILELNCASYKRDAGKLIKLQNFTLIVFLISCKRENFQIPLKMIKHFSLNKEKERINSG